MGLSIATLLAQHHHVTAVDILPEKGGQDQPAGIPHPGRIYRKIPGGEGPGPYRHPGRPRPPTGRPSSSSSRRPTNYDSKKNFFDTSAVETVIDLVMRPTPTPSWSSSPRSRWATPSISEKSRAAKTSCSAPEFLRESKALYDNLYPSRIIVGTDKNDPRLVEKARIFAGLLQEGALKENIDTLFMGFTEAGGRQAVCQHLPGAAGELLQRAGHLRRIQGPQHPGHHRRRLPGPPHRQPLQQPQFRLRRLLPAQGHQQLLAQLRRCGRKT